MRILVVDDEDIKRITLRDDLLDAGYDVDDAPDAEAGLRSLKASTRDVVITDIKMPGMSGLDFLKKIKSDSLAQFVVLMTGFGTVETAVQAIREGAYDYLTKPFSSEEMILVIKRIEELVRLKDENISLRQRLLLRQEQAVLVGQSPAIQRARDQINLMAQTDSPVMLSGETGVGKDLAAKMIHNNGPRSNEPFVKVSCAMYSVSVLESELFGHEKGAFTGAIQAHRGRFEAAGFGTVYLDEIDDIPMELQVKLLHVIEDRVIERVGGTKPIPFHARVVAATKRNLKHLIEEGKFRKDLYFRLNVLSLDLPSLRDYTEDLPYLIAHFLNDFGHNADAIRLAKDTMDCLKEYGWPGNVRELRNLVERLLFLPRKDGISLDDLEPLLFKHECSPGEIPMVPESFDDKTRAFERDLIKGALDSSSGNQSKAAENLKMKLSTFRDKGKKLGLLQ